jgi:hypothetical protein
VSFGFKGLTETVVQYLGTSYCSSAQFLIMNNTSMELGYLSIVSDCRLGNRVQFLAKDFSSSLRVQTSSEAHPVSYPVGTGGVFLKGKAWPRRGADQSPLSSAEVKIV